jgi:DNA-directed RNA polymerase specialized sigma subunit
MAKDKKGTIRDGGTIDPEIQKIINTSIEQAVKKAADAIMAANEQVEAEQRNYFRETEKLLYSLPALKLSLAEYDEDLKAGELIALRAKSKDVIRYSPNNSGVCGLHPDDASNSKVASIGRTRKQVQRIERALETVKDDLYYDIIPLKYFDGLSGEDIADRLNCEERTYRRHKNRLINKLKVVLFGADAL